MDFTKLKEIAKRLGGILVMDGNEPEFVVMSYDRFNALEAVPQSVPVSQAVPEDEQLIDALNKEILALKEEIRQKEVSEAEMV
ncbi:MAG: hypothetical protein AAB420_03530 [Patescibacteria group bacterium]